MIKYILKLISDRKVKRNLHRCSHCGSYNTKKGHYSRGWNDWLNQATGDNGVICNECLKITFFRSLEDYKAKLPNWCTAGQK